MNIFQNNLSALLQTNKALGLVLQNFTENTIYEIFAPENTSTADINIIDTRDLLPLYFKTPTQEIDEKLKEFERYEHFPLLYCFGIGNGYFYHKLLENPYHQTIMIFEPELEMIYIALNLVDFSQDILDKRVIINHTKAIDINACIAMLNDRSKYFLTVYDLHVHSLYYEKYIDDIKSIHQSLIQAFKHLSHAMGNSSEDTMIGLRHSLKNIPKMISMPTLNQLVSKSKVTKQAIIVSTGPSLAKQIPYLKKMQEYVTILCIDASFPILSQEGIKPDIVFSIERVKETGEFYKKTPKKFHKNVIFAIASVSHDATIDNIHGTTCMFLRDDSYNMFFELDEWGYLGGGMSAANFAYSFATRCNFDQIILIGQDLSYGKDGSSHSKNHVFGEDEVKDSKHYCNVVAYGGEGEVPTTRVWKSFLDSYVLQIAEHGIETINATEGGAKIAGTKEQPFQKICEESINKGKKKHQITLSKPSQEAIDKNQEKLYSKLEEAINLAKDMIKITSKAHTEADKFLTTIENYTDQQIIQKISLKKLSKYVNKITHIKERHNSEAFLKMYGLILMASVGNLEFLVAEVYVMRENNELAKKQKKIAWISIHQKWLSTITSNLEESLAILENSHSTLLIKELSIE